jgi:hypothetical protein
MRERSVYPPGDDEGLDTDAHKPDNFWRKASKLTGTGLTLMTRDVVDGGHIARRTLELPVR